jgi:hypothetical protein
MEYAPQQQQQKEEKKKLPHSRPKYVQQFLCHCSAHSQAQRQRQIWLRTFHKLMMVTLFEVR